MIKAQILYKEGIVSNQDKIYFNTLVSNFKYEIEDEFSEKQASSNQDEDSNHVKFDMTNQTEQSDERSS